MPHSGCGLGCVCRQRGLLCHGSMKPCARLRGGCPAGICISMIWWVPPSWGWARRDARPMPHAFDWSEVRGCGRAQNRRPHANTLGSAAGLRRGYASGGGAGSPPPPLREEQRWDSGWVDGIGPSKHDRSSAANLARTRCVCCHIPYALQADAAHTAYWKTWGKIQRRAAVHDQSGSRRRRQS